MVSFFKYIYILISCSFVYSLSKPINILFIGNSFTLRNNLPLQIKRLSNSDGIKIKTYTSARPAATFNSHSKSELTNYLINKFDDWNAIILQEQSSMFSNWQYRTRSLPYSKILYDKMKNHTNKVILYDTWGYRYGDPNFWNNFNDDFYKMSDRIEKGYIETKELLTDGPSVSIANVNDSWKKAYASFQKLLYNRDNFHPSIYGTYLTACAFYTSFFNKTSVGIKYRPSKISRKNARKLQKLAESILNNETPLN